MSHFVLATAGHVDHGKSALVKALTGTDPDRLPEEKKRGVTIDLGFAELPLTAKDGRQFSLGIVDVPGHEDFVRNMIAGVGSIDVGLLIVAADDVWMPQTEEHFQILSYLGVSRLVVAITKCDAADGESAQSQVRQQLEGSRFADSAIVQTSAKSGDGLGELKTALAETLVATSPPIDYNKARLPVDRVFTLRGIGTVVTGTLIGGRISVGDLVWVQPAGTQTRVRSLQSHNREIAVAQPGMRTALSLPEIEAGDAPDAAERGNMITATSAIPTQTIDALLHVSSRSNSETPVIGTNMKVDVHHGTARIRAIVKLFEQDSLAAGESGLAQLRLERPILAFYEDRFIVRNTAQKQTLAGGMVLDPDASRRRERKDQQLVFLRARAKDPESIQAAILTQLERDQFVTMATLLEKSSFSTDQISETLKRLAAEQKLHIAGSLVGNASAWKALRERAVRLVDQAHAENPQSPGLNLSLLRAKLRGHAREVIDAVLSDLVSGDFIRRDETVARRSHRAGLPDSLQSAASEILRLLCEKPLDPPALKTFIGNENARKALRFLIDSAQLIEIDSTLVLSAPSFEKMKDMIVAFLKTRPGGASASDIRQHLQTSRRIIIPLLEYLDRKKITRRQADLRILAG